VATYFADTCALIAYLKGDRAYAGYFEGNEIVTTKLNLMELYYISLAESNEEMAGIYYNTFLAKCVEIGDETIKKAMKFRYQQKKNFSYVDAIGYRLSLDIGIRFLTVDRQFKGLKNAEFAK